MAEVKWIKITTNVFDDEKIKLIDSMPDRDTLLVIWFKLLAMAGKTNDGGSIYIVKEIPTTDDMLSTILNRPLNTVRLAIKTFENFGMIEINKHINIVNWDKHQNIDGLKKIREQTRKRVEKFRDKNNIKNICNVTVTQCNATDIDIDKDKDIDIELDIDKEKDKELEIEIDKEKNKKKKVGTLVPVNFLKNEILKTGLGYSQTLIEFMEFRNSIKKPLTAISLKKIIEQFNNWSYTDEQATECLNNSIINGWQGIFELNPNKKNNKMSFVDKMLEEINDKTF